MSKKPHILIFNPDQLRADAVGHLGAPGAPTPAMDAWVETDAVSFANAICQAPVCTPSRCSFTTGLYPHVFGHRGLHHMLHADRGHKNMFKVLRDNGYFVWWGGKNDLIAGPEGPEDYSDIFFQADEDFFKRHGGEPQTDMHRGDQSWRGTPGSDTYYSFHRGELKHEPSNGIYMDDDWQNVLGAIDFIEAAPKDKPMCIYLPILFPHPPYGVETEFFDLVRDMPLPERRKLDTAQLDRKAEMLREIRKAQGLTEWSEERWDAIRRTYFGMVARVDRQFGMLMDALKRAGIYDDTAVFVFSDHGDYTGDYGVVEKSQNTFEDPLVNVPLIVKPPRPRRVCPGIRQHVMAELVDIAATVYDFAGVEAGYDQFGKSLSHTLASPAGGHKDYAFCEGGRREDEMQVSERESMTQFGTHPEDGLYFPRINIQVHNGRAHGRAVMIRSLTHKYIRRLDGQDEFYDLGDDPFELDNRIDDPAYAEIRAEMKERLLSWYLDTSDITPYETDSRWPKLEKKAGEAVFADPPPPNATMEP